MQSAIQATFDLKKCQVLKELSSVDDSRVIIAKQKEKGKEFLINVINHWERDSKKYINHLKQSNICKMLDKSIFCSFYGSFYDEKTMEFW